MSQIILSKRYAKSIKFQAVLDRISETVYQGCIQIYGLLFWLFSVLMNHWKLKKEEPINIDYNFLADSDRKLMNDSLSEKSTQSKGSKKGRRSSSSSGSSSNGGDDLPPKPKYSPPTAFTLKNNDGKRKKFPSSGGRRSDNNNYNKKQSLSLKSHMLSWKQKLSHSQPSSPVDPVPTKSLSSSLPNKVSPSIPKRSFLRRLSSANSAVYSDNESVSGNSKPDLPSPTTPTSLLKSFTFKMKKQEVTLMTDDNSPFPLSPVDFNSNTTNSRSRRLSLTSFRRKIYPDSAIKSISHA